VILGENIEYYADLTFSANKFFLRVYANFIRLAEFSHGSGNIDVFLEGMEKVNSII
jgi:hypothetical protein